MSFFRKRCPYCSRPLSFRKLFLNQPYALDCPDCGERMSFGHWSLRLFASTTGTLFSWTPIYLGFRDHRWWLLAIPGIVVMALWRYGFMIPQRVRRA